MTFGCHIWLTFTILINQVCGLGYFRTRFDPWAVSRNEQPTVMDVAYVLCETLTVIPRQMFLSADLLLHFLPISTLTALYSPVVNSCATRFYIKIYCVWRCTYIVFNNLKFTLKRSYMFRLYDHPQGAYFVPC